LSLSNLVLKGREAKIKKARRVPPLKKQPRPSREGELGVWNGEDGESARHKAREKNTL